MRGLHMEQEALRRISHEGVDDGQPVGHTRKAVGTLRIGGRTAIGPDDGNGDTGHRKALFIAHRTGQFAFFGPKGGGSGGGRRTGLGPYNDHMPVLEFVGQRRPAEQPVEDLAQRHIHGLYRTVRNPGDFARIVDERQTALLLQFGKDFRKGRGRHTECNGLILRHGERRQQQTAGRQEHTQLSEWVVVEFFHVNEVF